MDVSLKKLKRKYSLNSKVVVVAVVVILILINLISTRTFTRFDWTRNDRFTISDFTIAMLESLGDVITVKAYVSANLPASIKPVSNQLRDILDEYQAYSDGNFQYRFVDPATDEDAMAEAQRLGIRPIEMQVRDKDSFSTQRGFMGLGIFYGGNQEVIPVVQDFENLEYEISSILLKLVLEKKVVAFLKGHGEHGIEGTSFQGGDKENDYMELKKILERNYEVGVVDLSDGKPIEGVNTLIVAGGDEVLSERDLFEIDQFIMSGGNVIFMMDKIAQTLGISVTERKSNNLNDLIEGYGLRVETNMVMDSVSDYANFSSGGPFTFLVQYPPFVKVVNSSLPDHPIVNRIDNAVFRWVSRVATSALEGIEYVSLLSTSELGWVDEGNDGLFEIDPNKIVKPGEDAFGKQDLAVLATGVFPSQFESVPKLQEREKDDDGAVTLRNAAKDEYRDREVAVESPESTKLLVVSDSDFVTDEVIRSSQSSLLFLLNSVDFLTLGDGLIDIRAKNLGSPAIRQLTDGTKSLIKYVGVLFMPLLITLYGVTRFYFRRRS